MQVYTLVIVVVIPSFACLTLNLMIFKYVRSSSKRVQAISHGITQTELGSNGSALTVVSQRDLRLLRHIIVMFCIFICGWSPVYIYAVVLPDMSFASLTITILILVAEVALLVDILNLYFYNKELRQQLKNFICRCAWTN